MREYSEHPNFFCVDHPLILHKLSHLRDKSCGLLGFRTMLREISSLIAYEILRDLPLELRKISTPLTDMDAPFLSGPEICIVPVLRAGLAMAEGMLDIVPTAQVGHVGVYRDHETKKPIEYLVRLPKNVGQNFFIVDPMLATGNSLAHACDVLTKRGIEAKKIRVMALVAAPEGVSRFYSLYPDVKVYCASLDERLNENAYIVPGLGDAGDRLYGTE